MNRPGVKMLFERISAEGLAHFSYLVGSGSKAFVVDPRRDCGVYVDRAGQENMRITHVFETHRNEDYVTGSLELAERTGAKVLHGPGAERGYGEALGDGDRFGFGELELTALRTPGHTGDSMTYVLGQVGGPSFAAFTGDALFVGDVGRTDLLGPESTERLSRVLFRSLHQKILALDDGVLVCPAHGAGSVCGGDIGEREFSTIGLERSQNPMLRLGEDEFVRRKAEERLDFPPYFRRMESMNVGRRPAMSGMPDPWPMPPKEFAEAMRAGGLVLDVRMAESFAGACIKDALSIWIDGLAPYAGWILPYDRPILLVTSSRADLDRAVRTLVRMGFDDIRGFLRGGMAQWLKEGMRYETIPTMSVHQLRRAMNEGEVFLLDPRPQHEWEEYRVPGAAHIFVGELERRLGEVPQDRPVACMCSSGFRGSMAAALLKWKGYSDARNVLGGIGAWRAAGYEVEEGP